MSNLLEKVPQEAIEKAKQVSCISLAERHTELRREGAGEMAGPCPKCGGDDRFHVQDSWWFCRQCHEKRGDSIALLRWLEPGLSFGDAVAQLAGEIPMARPARRSASAKKRKQQPEAWRPKAERLLAEMQERLFSGEGEPGQQYLEGRKIESGTWLTFGLGYSLDAAGRGPAIAMPWYAGGSLVAIRYRLLKPQGSQKVVSQPGSQYAGRLFGGQVLLGAGEQYRTLIVCEGEINAMSIWQVARDMRMDVLSLGSESAKLSEAARERLRAYQTIITWADRTEIAASLAESLPGAIPVRSPGEKDANDLLQVGLLGGFIAEIRARACTTNKAKEALLWDLFDAALLINGIDTGSAQICKRLASKLRRQVDLMEPELGRWTTAFLE